MVGNIRAFFSEPSESGRIYIKSHGVSETTSSLYGWAGLDGWVTLRRFE
jgi:hypothetical protein